MTLPKFGDHRCSQCSNMGSCSMETSARFFGANPSALEEAEEALKGLEGFLDSLLVDSCNCKEDDYFVFVALTAFTTGFAMARGAQPIKSKPSMIKILSALEKVLSRRSDLRKEDK